MDDKLVKLGMEDVNCNLAPKNCQDWMEIPYTFKEEGAYTC